MKTIGKRRPANISRWSDFSPNAYCISFVEFVKLTIKNAPYLLMLQLVEQRGLL